MNNDEAKKVLNNEMACVKRQGTPACPARDCAACDLLLPAETVLEAYALALNALNGPKKGEWLHPYATNIACECSNCHMQMPITDYFNFCPHCGACMIQDAQGDAEDIQALIDEERQLSEYDNCIAYRGE